MLTVSELMSGDHRDCDDEFALIEQGLATGNWDITTRAIDVFRGAMERHLGAEESILFPAFESATGITMGPTRVMRMEHLQMRALFDEISAAAADKDADGLSGQLETLLIMMQQHNLKEENVLYPMCDQHLVAELPDVTGALGAEVVRAA